MCIKKKNVSLYKTIEEKQKRVWSEVRRNGTETVEVVARTDREEGSYGDQLIEDSNSQEETTEVDRVVRAKSRAYLS